MFEALNKAKDIVSNHNGLIEARAKGSDLSGAEFIVRIPVHTDKE